MRKLMRLVVQPRRLATLYLNQESYGLFAVGMGVCDVGARGDAGHDNGERAAIPGFAFDINLAA